MSLYVKNTYPPPCNRIQACYVIQSFCFEPTGDLLKGIVIRDVGDEQRSALSMYSLKFLNFYTLIRQPQHPALVTTRSVPRRSLSIHQTVLSLLLYYHPSTSEDPLIIHRSILLRHLLRSASAPGALFPFWKRSQPRVQLLPS